MSSLLCMDVCVWIAFGSEEREEDPLFCCQWEGRRNRPVMRLDGEAPTSALTSMHGQL